MPVNPDTLPPPENRPAHAVMWSNVSAWNGTEAGYGGNYGNGSFGLPLDGDNVMIKSGEAADEDLIIFL